MFVALRPLLALSLFAFLSVPALAYERYHDEATPDDGACATCHPGFLGRGDLHDMHEGTIGIDCADCHTGSGRNNPFVMWSQTGYGCAGCHGREYGETIEADYGFGLTGLPKASGYGLRKQHLAKGETVCLDCHADVRQCDILPEIVLGPVAVWYGIDSCDSLSEDSTPEPNGDDNVGLDNDGDTLIDDEDPDCSGCADLDGDGYGAPASSDCPNLAEDCDDCDRDVNAGIVEASASGNCADGLDNDCDGLMDDLDPDCVGAPDRDGDGVPDATDNCPDVSNTDQADGDGDGVGDSCDGCAADPDKTDPGVCGCGVADTDGDGDGTPDCIDGCAADPDKTDPGACGCGVADTDGDGDGTPDCNDGCAADPDKTEPGACGCGVADTDGDGDGTPDCIDGCAADPDKTDPGACGCGVADTDGDGDGTPDCIDGCAADPDKTDPGACGCGVADTDGDGDGTPDCIDGCAADPDKTEPGVCGCGVADTDGDGDGTPDCIDGCAADPDKTEPGVCGCGVADTDGDSDGVPGCDDCDDADMANFPGNLEDCSDGGDNDCDDEADCADADCTMDPACAGSDLDGDGVFDATDNCVRTWNPGQADGDVDGVGNACDPDDEVLPIVLGRGGASDVVVSWGRTPTDLGQPEYEFYRVFRGDLLALAAGSRLTPDWTHVPLPGACVDPSAGREKSDPSAGDGASYYYLVVGWSATGEGAHGWIDAPPVGDQRPGPEDQGRPPQPLLPSCP